MILMKTARKVNQYVKRQKKEQAGKYLSLVRRIERTAPLSDKRIVAITFDDGPNAEAPAPNINNYDKGLTSALLDILKAYNAKGTFNVIGSTAHNYPDKIGKLHTASWGGTKYDHYPDFNKDSLAGIENQIALAKRMIDEGHELSNHTYSHIIFGSIMLIYGKRVYLKGFDAVVEDLRKLHMLVKDKLDYDMKLSRPPHYIDRIAGGFSSYDAYAVMGYNYLAASFDGGGWKPSTGDYNKDVQLMLTPLENVLKENPEALNGQIIFHKDGCNMSKETPVADALPKYLRLLADNGYKVVTASELLSLSPFSDVPQKDSDFETIRALEKTGYCVGYKDNTFKPDKQLTLGELAMMITPPDIIRKNYALKSNISSEVAAKTYKNISSKHPYYAGIAYCFDKGFFSKAEAAFDIDKIVDVKTFERVLSKLSEGIKLSWSASSNNVITRRNVSKVLLSYIEMQS